MNDSERGVLAELARLADDLGPALVPPGHTELLDSITEVAMKLFHAAACSIALLSEDQTELIYHVASGAGEEKVEGMRIPASQGIAGWVVTSGQPIGLEDVTRDPRFARDVAETTGYVPTAIVAMPLETDRKMLGVISVLDPDTETAPASDMDTLGIFARQAAIAIENSDAFNRLGRALFAAAARASTSDALVRALEEVAAETIDRADDDIAELARQFHELEQLGPTEKRAAVELVAGFVRYAKAASKQR
ncbi:MAG TPA: GAF domain-containing protein [Actinomycetota bacterium]|nr:GAF domain-containing protein [Actinomycetota bacterium]